MWLVLFLLHLQSKHYIPDKAIDSLLKFLSTLFGVIGRFSQIGKEISECFPKTSYALQRYADIVRPIKSFVVCRDCNSVYNMKDCIDRPGVSKVCDFKEFPCTRKCSTLLLKTVELASHKKILHPFKAYCYQSLKDSLTDFTKNPISIHSVSSGEQEILLQTCLRMSTMVKCGEIFKL